MNNNLIIKALAIRPFFFLVLTEIFSQIAVNMLYFVVIIVVFTISSSNTAVAGAILSFTIPQLLFGLLAGVYVDKWNKKKVLYASNFLRAVLVFLLIFFHSNLALIYIMTFAISLVSQFFIPAESPMIPIVVRRSLLLSANAIFGMVIYSSIFIAYAISGPSLLFLGPRFTFAALAISFLLAAFFATFIKVKMIRERKFVDLDRFRISLADEARVVVEFFRKAKIIYQALFLLTFAQIIILVLAAIGPGYAQQILRIRVEEFPVYFVTPAVIGAAFSAVILGSYLHRHPKSRLTKIGLFLLGISILILPYVSKVESRSFIQTINSYLPQAFDITILHIMVVLAFIMGIANSLIFIPSNTILQEETSEQFRGKVYGALNTMVGLFSLLPILIVGGLADVFGIKGVITGIGIAVLSIGVISWMINKR